MSLKLCGHEFRNGQYVALNAAQRIVWQTAVKLSGKSSNPVSGDCLKPSKNNAEGSSKVLTVRADSSTQQGTVNADLKGSAWGWKCYQRGKWSCSKTAIRASFVKNRWYFGHGEKLSVWEDVWSFREKENSCWSEQRRRQHQKAPKAAAWCIPEVAEWGRILYTIMSTVQAPWLTWLREKRLDSVSQQCLNPLKV